MSNDFRATIRQESERARDWQAVFGSREIPLRSPFPHEATAPGIACAWFYDIDLSLLTAGQRARLITHITTRFRIDEREVAADLDIIGCPILAEDVIVTVSNPQKWL